MASVHLHYPPQPVNCELSDALEYYARFEPDDEGPLGLRVRIPEIVARW